MWFDRVPVALRRIYGGAAPTPPPEALEQALLAEHARLYPPRVRGWAFAHRWALACVATTVAAVAACQVPVDYEREFGASVGCELPRETWPEVQLESVAQELAQELGAERLAIRAHDDDGPTRSFRVDLWGAEDVDDAALLAALHVHAPAIPAGACATTPLAGTVHGTLGGRLGYRLLDLDLDRRDVEEARREILAKLAEQGLHGSADVEIRDAGDGKREVKIRIEAYRPDGTSHSSIEDVAGVD